MVGWVINGIPCDSEFLVWRARARQVRESLCEQLTAIPFHHAGAYFVEEHARSQEEGGSNAQESPGASGDLAAALAQQDQVLPLQGVGGPRERPPERIHHDAARHHAPRLQPSAASVRTLSHACWRPGAEQNQSPSSWRLPAVWQFGRSQRRK